MSLVDTIPGVLFVVIRSMLQRSKAGLLRHPWRYDDHNKAEDNMVRLLAYTDAAAAKLPCCNVFCSAPFLHESRAQMHGWLIAVSCYGGGIRRNCEYRFAWRMIGLRKLIARYRRLSRNTACSPNRFQNHHGALSRSGEPQALSATALSIRAPATKQSCRKSLIVQKWMFGESHHA